MIGQVPSQILHGLIGRREEAEFVSLFRRLIKFVTGRGSGDDLRSCSSTPTVSYRIRSQTEEPARIVPIKRSGQVSQRGICRQVELFNYPLTR